MNRIASTAALTLAALALGPAHGARGTDDPSTIYQLRTYTTAPEKLDVLVERFGRVNLPLFEAHGITLVGAWTPHESDEGGDRLVYLVSFPGPEAAEAAWEAFSADPKWVEAFEAEGEEHGQVVTGVEAVYVKPTDFSPTLPAPDPTGGEDEAETDQGDETRLFELRRYTASPGKLDALNARFRDHTMELFDKHGMTNLIYTVPLEQDTGAGELLVYFLAHPSHVQALNSWESFRTDPVWIKARDESQADGVPLAAKVERTFLIPTPFSPLK
ncbi:NIPSNAP family protein [Tautonia plasticadhaerens]|uniref:NIPSNAP domain-containing protein n=1 Tax=Tautonia plasticadhaerens TaxID=2527974 RepID=A0A518H9G4_9BACT|nr:NIPSNAP family protein [Tautonia plasticadhaerens]QDV37376.1 hypothetical protein ElP_53140 [Tautonia plasticadhaerens]